MFRLPLRRKNYVFFAWVSLLDLSSHLLVLHLCWSLDAVDRVKIEAVETCEIIFIFELFLQLAEVSRTCTEAKQHQNLDGLKIVKKMYS